MHFDLVFLLFGCLIAGYRAYIAWFMPERHQSYLNWLSTMYNPWAPNSKATMTSQFNFWFTRYLFLVMFVVLMIMTIVIFIKELTI